MIQEILDLGFDCVELGHGTRLPLMTEILKMHDAGKVRISSLHNFCPLPIEFNYAAPDSFQFSSPSESERERAFRLTCQTIDFAERLNASAVVLHLGSIRMTSVTKKLLRMMGDGKQFSRLFVKKKIEAVQLRASKASRSLPYVKDCLKRILEYSANKGVRLGIEGRFGYEEIPIETEVTQILEEFDSPLLGYWHDFGHIQIKENIGFLDHADWLKKITNRLIGCHLHDVKWPGRDHLAPLRGMIDFLKLIPLLDKDALLVWEMGPKVPAERIARSLEIWKDRFGE